jgi:hypothetical protein
VIFPFILLNVIEDFVLVNSEFSTSTIARTVRSLHAKGTELAILFQAVSVEQFDETRA